MSTKRSISIHDLRKINVLNNPQLSPDGTTFAFTRQFITEEEEYTSHLFVQKMNEDKAEQWTFGDGKVTFPRFSPDGRWLVYVAKKPQDKHPQLYLISKSGGESKPITQLPEGASQPIWSPDSSKILFSTSFEKGQEPNSNDLATVSAEKESKKSKPLVVERLKYKSDASGFLDKKNNQLAYYDMREDNVHFLTDDNVDHEPSGWSPNGKTITYFSNKQGDEHIVSDIYVLDLETKEHKQLTDGRGMFTHATFSPDGSSLACFGHEKEYAGATHHKIWMIDMKTKKRTCVTSDWDVHVSDAMIGDIRSANPNPGPVWSLDNSSFYVLASEWGNTNLYNITLKGQVKPVTAGNHHVFGFSMEESSNQIILGISSPTEPGEIYSYKLDSNRLEKKTMMNESFLKSVEIQKPEEVLLKGSDGLPLQGWLLKPVGFKEGESYPGILEIHGGPHAMYGNTFFHELQLFAAEGYAVFYSNPRGSHGYGQSFVDACRGDYGGMDYDDVMTFTDTVLDNYSWIDQHRLGVTGGSYGGFMTNWIVGHTNRFKAAATLRCISNWTSFYGVSDIGYFFTEWEVGANFLQDPDKLWLHSPLKYVNNMETPLLIMHGEKDYRCPVEQAEQLFVALKQRGKNPRFVRFPEANHELSRSGPPHLRFARLEELKSWFNNYLS